MKKLAIFLAIQLLLLYYLSISSYFISLVLQLVYLVSKMRYSLKIVPLQILCWIQNRNIQILTDIKEIKRVMQISDKGRGIEELFSQEGFAPILSIESVNGKDWERLRNNFLIFGKYTPSLGKLAFIANNEVKKSILNQEIINSATISKLTIKIFLKWLFCENHLKCEKNESKENKYSNIN